MKHSLTLILIMSLVGISLGQQGRTRGLNDAERLVRTAFQEDFRGATQAKWTTEDGQYVVHFKHENMDVKAIYDTRAALLMKEFLVPKSRYRPNIMAYMDDHFPGYQLESMYLCSGEEVKCYRLAFIHNGQKQEIKFKLSGDRL